jgi:AcrR family transcriptional regulator
MSEALTQPRTRNRRGEGSRLRDEIVTAAGELLDEAGTDHAVTLRAVARKIGIAAPSIYPHFPDQPSIMLAVVTRALAELETQLKAAAPDASAPARDRLLAVSRAYLAYADSNPMRYRTMFGGAWIPEAGTVSDEELLALGTATLGFLTELLTACVAEGTSTSRDPSGDAIALWLGLHGLAHQRASTRLLPGPEDLADRIITGLAHLSTT